MTSILLGRACRIATVVSLVGWLAASAAPSPVVINEVFYHAPGDREDLQWVELHNAGTTAADLGGWSFSKGLKLTFKPGTRIEPGGYLVVARDAGRFASFHEVPLAATFASKLSRKGERIELSDASGKVVDAVQFSDKAPWPSGADGASGSLERVCPGASSDDPANWVASPLSVDRERPMGTPGARNAGFQPSLPPVVTSLAFAPSLPATNQPVTVDAEVRGSPAVARMELLYRVASAGNEREEVAIPMVSAGPGKHRAVVPPQAQGSVIRMRVRATGVDGVARLHPAPTEPGPAVSAFVPWPVAASAIPQAWIIHTTSGESKAALARARAMGRGPMEMFLGPPPDAEAEARADARKMLEQRLDLSSWWFAWTVRLAPDEPGRAGTWRGWMRDKLAARGVLMDRLLDGPGIEDRLESLPGVAEAFMDAVAKEAAARLTEARRGEWTSWVESRRNTGNEGMITSRADLEGAWHALSLGGEPAPDVLARAHEAFRRLDVEREAILAEVRAGMGKARLFREQRDRAETLGDAMPGRLKPLLDPGAAGRLERWKEGPREVVVGLRKQMPGGREGRGVGPRREGPGGFMPLGGAPQPRGSFQSALAYHDPATGKMEFFDFVQVNGRKGGQKVHLEGGATLGGMTTFALIHEETTAALVEPLAFEIYRRAGLAVQRSHPVRLHVDGVAEGHVVLVEQPNRAFLRRSGIPDKGHLYKLLWFGGDLVGQHEKHSRRNEGHADLVALVEGLGKASGDAQWKYIQKHFDVDQVAGYFAVNTVLSHWDGFFNNYFAYHDSEGTGRWMMFPWDQDSTWGLRAMSFGGDVFHTMPLTFGMNGDEPVEGGWWRGPGFFSGPLLANARFRQVFLGRVKHILGTVYTEPLMNRLLDESAAMLVPEARFRAMARGEDPDRAAAQLKSDIERCRRHVRLRRNFLLAQPELKALPTP